MILGNRISTQDCKPSETRTLNQCSSMSLSIQTPDYEESGELTPLVDIEVKYSEPRKGGYYFTLKKAVCFF